jgi:hypothetical protein
MAGIDNIPDEIDEIIKKHRSRNYTDDEID